MVGFICASDRELEDDPYYKDEKMNDLTNAQKHGEITAPKQVIDAHKFLLDFLNKFDAAKRGGIHDFMELTVFNMVNSAVKSIDDYLQSGHKEVDATQIMHIVTDSYQTVLDKIKRNLDSMNTVNFR